MRFLAILINAILLASCAGGSAVIRDHRLAEDEHARIDMATAGDIERSLSVYRLQVQDPDDRNSDGKTVADNTFYEHGTSTASKATVAIAGTLPAAATQGLLGVWATSIKADALKDSGDETTFNLQGGTSLANADSDAAANVEAYFRNLERCGEGRC